MKRCPSCDNDQLHSTEDTTIDYPITVDADGEITYTGGHYDITDDTITTFKNDICCHDCGWRGTTTELEPTEITIQTETPEHNPSHNHPARPSDDPTPYAATTCKDCGQLIIWIGPNTNQWEHAEPATNSPDETIALAQAAPLTRETTPRCDLIDSSAVVSTSWQGSVEAMREESMALRAEAERLSAIDADGFTAVHARAFATGYWAALSRIEQVKAGGAVGAGQVATPAGHTARASDNTQG